MSILRPHPRAPPRADPAAAPAAAAAGRSADPDRPRPGRRGPVGRDRGRRSRSAGARTPPPRRAARPASSRCTTSARSCPSREPVVEPDARRPEPEPSPPPEPVVVAEPEPVRRRRARARRRRRPTSPRSSPPSRRRPPSPSPRRRPSSSRSPAGSGRDRRRPAARSPISQRHIVGYELVVDAPRRRRQGDRRPAARRVRRHRPRAPRRPPPRLGRDDRRVPARGRHAARPARPRRPPAPRRAAHRGRPRPRSSASSSAATRSRSTATTTSSPPSPSSSASPSPAAPTRSSGPPIAEPAARGLELVATGVATPEELARCTRARLHDLPGRVLRPAPTRRASAASAPAASPRSRALAAVARPDATLRGPRARDRQRRRPLAQAAALRQLGVLRAPAHRRDRARGADPARHRHRPPLGDGDGARRGRRRRARGARRAGPPARPHVRGAGRQPRRSTPPTATSPSASSRSPTRCSTPRWRTSWRRSRSRTRSAPRCCAARARRASCSSTVVAYEQAEFPSAADGEVSPAQAYGDALAWAGEAVSAV